MGGLFFPSLEPPMLTLNITKWRHIVDSCQCIQMAMDIINSYCKSQQRADLRKMSENSKFTEKYLRKNGPGAASAQVRKSKLWYNSNTPNESLGKVPKFHGASVNGFCRCCSSELDSHVTHHEQRTRSCGEGTARNSGSKRFWNQCKGCGKMVYFLLFLFSHHNS